jgi:hypothetical protein
MIISLTLTNILQIAFEVKFIMIKTLFVTASYFWPSWTLYKPVLVSFHCSEIHKQFFYVLNDS